MSRFKSPAGFSQKIWAEVLALKARMNAISTPDGKIRSEEGGSTVVGVLTNHGHMGVGDGGAIPRGITFIYPDSDLASGVFIPSPSWPLLTKINRPTNEAAQRFRVIASTAGTGTNTILLESATGNPFTGSPSWTVRATMALSTLKLVEVDGSFSGWRWDPLTEYLRVRCSAVGATAPKDVCGVFDWN